ncbi:hypothetical protein TNCV_3730071 [Trichonephila clavipes]|nr:hypothetical protein TNCV_3730071 [Trichonephila clavipes]
MVTGDEKWITYDNIVGKRSWSKRGEADQTMAKPGLKARKVLLCICEGSTVKGLERNYMLEAASAWPNSKFKSLLSTTGYFVSS